MISKRNFHAIKIFEEDFAAFEMYQSNVTIDKAINVGMAILDISKTLMYNFHYDYILPTFK